MRAQFRRSVEALRLTLALQVPAALPCHWLAVGVVGCTANHSSAQLTSTPRSTDKNAVGCG
jgi:hypothetical protein